MSNKGITASDLIEQVGPIPPHSVLIFYNFFIPEYLLGIRRPGEEIQWTPRAGEKLRKLRREHVLCPVRKLECDFSTGKHYSFAGDNTILMAINLSTCPHITTPGSQFSCCAESGLVEMFYHGEVCRRFPVRRDDDE